MTATVPPVPVPETAAPGAVTPTTRGDVLVRVRSAARGPWTTSLLAGTLIALALVAEHLADRPDLGAPPMLLAAAVAGLPIARRALSSLRTGSVGIELLVTVAAGGAIVIGERWEAAAVTFLFAVGHALEAMTLGRTRRALGELLDLAPSTATVLRDGIQVVVLAGEVLTGETVVIKSGDRVPVDGRVLDGGAAVDEASITGESIPVEKSAGAQVFAGTISQGGFLVVRATGVGQDTTLARVIHRVEQAQEEKAPAQRLIERFARWYTPGIIVGAVVAGVVTGDVELALTLLVIGCPGALVISTPVSIVAGIGQAARRGILVKGGEHLETAARITAVAFDKTGTLTRGRPVLTDVIPAPGTTRDDLLHWAATAEAGSEHPLARPVLVAAERAGLTPPALPDAVLPHPGRGIEARTGTHRVLVGSLRMIEDARLTLDPATRETVRALAAAGRTPLVVALDEGVLGVLGVADELRPEARAAVDALRAGGATLVMLTGDDARVARAVAATVGIQDVRAGLLPEDKLDAVRALQAQGHVVAMVGDGVNDAPALAAADVGIAMGAAGSGVAVETADVALLAADLLRVPEAVALARATVRTVRQNVAVSLVTVTVLIAGVLLGGVTMALGMFVHQASVLVVIANGMRLLRTRRATVDVEGAATPSAR
ncbi:cation-translocating P-type ATPase [Actinotalea sp. K2]|uniref:heavy metal translocating P-type ATPase n=1 Tax=Actinotalea sp. K2 TaxID=2939438 RepID=UPI002017FD18|nr:cation-translocating P-type ATPase [Actinotalea sp. K2]MCL3862882.1 cation-translocating P-type ATPase [Actinotalea sp. K2]